MRCFVRRFTLGLDEAGAFLWRLVDWGNNMQERDKQIVYVIRIAVNVFFSATARSKMACRRGRLEVIRCLGRTVVRQRNGAKLDGKELR